MEKQLFLYRYSSFSHLVLVEYVICKINVVVILFQKLQIRIGSLPRLRLPNPRLLPGLQPGEPHSLLLASPQSPRKLAHGVGRHHAPVHRPRPHRRRRPGPRRPQRWSPRRRVPLDRLHLLLTWRLSRGLHLSGRQGQKRLSFPQSAAVQLGFRRILWF